MKCSIQLYTADKYHNVIMMATNEPLTKIPLGVGQLNYITCNTLMF